MSYAMGEAKWVEASRPGHVFHGRDARGTRGVSGHLYRRVYGRSRVRIMVLMSSTSEATVRVCPAGWSYEDWKGIVYPEAMPRSVHPLSILLPIFDTIEVNSTFYRPPNPRHCEGWVARVAEKPAFRFTVKLWERFTHQRDEWPTPREIQVFREGIAPLKEAGRLGAVLVQFPWSFKRTPENRLWLARVVDTFADHPLTLEVRHASWNVPEVYAGLRARQVAFCNIDQPMFDNSIAPDEQVTSAVGYVRLHGRNHDDWFREDAGRNDRYNYLYNEDELKPWIEKIRRMKKHVNDLFVITNNHYRGQAVVNAIEIQAAIGAARYPLPARLVEAYPRLGKHAREGAAVGE